MTLELSSLDRGPIKLQRSLTANAQPPPLALEEGEIALNLVDRVIYSKDDQGNVIIMGQDYSEAITSLTPLYLVNPPTGILATDVYITDIDYWNSGDITYSIDNSKYDIGDQINISRCSDTAGTITIDMVGGNNFIVRGLASVVDLTMSGTDPFVTRLRKATSTSWVVKVTSI